MEYVDTGIASAADNMAIDAQLLEELAFKKEPIFHTYSWQKPCATFGYFNIPEKWLNIKAAEALGVELARRPTGGGITFHTSDLAFSFLLPGNHPAYSSCTIDNYAFVNHAVAKAITSLQKDKHLLSLLFSDVPSLSEGCRHFCMACPTQYDLTIDSRKVGGAAQRRTRHGYLHQGTVALVWTDEAMLQSILLDEGIAKAMRTHSFPLLGDATQEELATARVELLQAIYHALYKALDL